MGTMLDSYRPWWMRVTGLRSEIISGSFKEEPKPEKEEKGFFTSVKELFESKEDFTEIVRIQHNLFEDLWRFAAKDDLVEAITLEQFNNLYKDTLAGGLVLKAYYFFGRRVMASRTDQGVYVFRENNPSLPIQEGDQHDPLSHIRQAGEMRLGITKDGVNVTGERMKGIAVLGSARFFDVPANRKPEDAVTAIIEGRSSIISPPVVEKEPSAVEESFDALVDEAKAAVKEKETEEQKKDQVHPPTTGDEPTSANGDEDVNGKKPETVEGEYLGKEG